MSGSPPPTSQFERFRETLDEAADCDSKIDLQTRFDRVCGAMIGLLAMADGYEELSKKYQAQSEDELEGPSKDAEIAQLREDLQAQQRQVQELQGNLEVLQNQAASSQVHRSEGSRIVNPRATVSDTGSASLGEKQKNEDEHQMDVDQAEEEPGQDTKRAAITPHVMEPPKKRKKGGTRDAAPLEVTSNEPSRNQGKKEPSLPVIPFAPPVTRAQSSKVATGLPKAVPSAALNVAGNTSNENDLPDYTLEEIEAFMGHYMLPRFNSQIGTCSHSFCGLGSHSNLYCPVALGIVPALRGPNKRKFLLPNFRDPKQGTWYADRQVSVPALRKAAPAWLREIGHPQAPPANSSFVEQRAQPQ